MEKKIQTTIMVLHVETSYRVLEHFLCGPIRSPSTQARAFMGLGGSCTSPEAEKI